MLLLSGSYLLLIFAQFHASRHHLSAPWAQTGISPSHRTRTEDGLSSLRHLQKWDCGLALTAQWFRYKRKKTKRRNTIFEISCCWLKNETQWGVLCSFRKVINRIHDDVKQNCSSSCSILVLFHSLFVFSILLRNVAFFNPYIVTFTDVGKMRICF